MKPTEHFISQHDTAWLKLKSSQNTGDSCCKKQSEKGHCPFPMCDFQWAVKVHFKNCHAFSNHLLLSRCFVQQCFYFFLFIHFSLILIRQLSDGWFSLVISVRKCVPKSTQQDIVQRCKGHFYNPPIIFNIMPTPQILQHVSHWPPFACFPARWGVKVEHTADC